MAGLSAVTIDLGAAHTCVVITGGSVKCWGGNDFGQLGIGSTIVQKSPADVDLWSGALVS